jgi:hypothetical protein
VSLRHQPEVSPCAVQIRVWLYRMMTLGHVCPLVNRSKAWGMVVVVPPGYLGSGYEEMIPEEVPGINPRKEARFRTRQPRTTILGLAFFSA